MRYVAFGLTLVALTQVVFPATAQEETHPMPFVPYESAKEGGPVALLASSETDGHAGKMLVTSRVSKIAGDQLTIVVAPRRPGVAPTPEQAKEFPKKRVPTIEEFFELQKTRLTDLRVSDEKKIVGGREFACSKVAFKSKRTIELKASPNLVIVEQRTYWLSAEARPNGIVAATQDTDVTGGGAAPMRSHTTFELVGLGSGDKATWGKNPDEVDLGTAEYDPEQDPKIAGSNVQLPLNPYATARPRDWESILATWHIGSGSGTVVRTWSIASGDEDSVKVTHQLRTTKGIEATIDGVSSRKTSPSVNAFGFTDLKAAIVDMKTADEKLTLDGREFACTKVSYAKLWTGTHGQTRETHTFWFSSAIKGAGIVAFSEKSERGGEVINTAEGHVVGFGNGDDVEWGKKGADVPLEGK